MINSAIDENKRSILFVEYLTLHEQAYIECIGYKLKNISDHGTYSYRIEF